MLAQWARQLLLHWCCCVAAAAVAETARLSVPADPQMVRDLVHPMSAGCVRCSAVWWRARDTERANVARWVITAAEIAAGRCRGRLLHCRVSIISV
jgi:hypothetical protein